jgi:hypothetical protein
MGAHIALRPLSLADGPLEPGEVVPAHVIDEWSERNVLDKLILAGELYYEPEAGEEYHGPQANVPFGAIGAPVLPTPEVEAALEELNDAGLANVYGHELAAMQAERSVEGDGLAGAAEDDSVGDDSSAPADEDEEVEDEGEFHSYDHTVAEVAAYAIEHPEEIDRLYDEEVEQPNARKSLIGKLEYLSDQLAAE